MKTNPGLSKILPMKDPRLTAYADTANIQAIVFNCKYSDDWYNNDFIQLYGYNRPLNGTVLIMFRNPKLDECVFTRDYFQNINKNIILKKWNSIIDF